MGNWSASPDSLVAIGARVLVEWKGDRRGGKGRGGEKRNGKGRNCLIFI